MGKILDILNLVLKGMFLALVGLVDCPNLVTWICQLCSITNTSEKYERTQQGNLLLKSLLFGESSHARVTSVVSE